MDISSRSGALEAFPIKSYMRWRRLDVPGREEARIEQTAEGWRLTGQVEAEEASVRAQLRYVIECDRDWRTRRAVVTGSASAAPIRFEFVADGDGHWTPERRPAATGRRRTRHRSRVHSGYESSADPTSRPRGRRARGGPDGMGAVSRASGRGAGANVSARGSPRLPLRALVDGERFQARLDTDEFGRVLLYEGLWEAEVAFPDQARAYDPLFARSRSE